MNPRRYGRRGRGWLGVGITTASICAAALAPASAQLPGSTSTTTPTATSTSTSTSTSTVPTTTTLPATTVGPSTVAPTTSPASTDQLVTVSPATTAPAPSTTAPPAAPAPPPASLSEASVSSLLAARSRTSSSSTDELLAALRPLQDFGISAMDAAMVGMGRFPLAGLAYWSDDFGDPRLTPELHSHQGTDIFAAFDVPVRSPADGVVAFADEAVGGKAAYVTEPDGTWYYLAHLNGFAPGLPSGSVVRTGQLIGFNGDTGNAKGGAPHVHFEVHPGGGAAVNPKPYLDQWLAEALAAVPSLFAPYRTGVSRPLAALGVARHLDRGMLSGPSRLLAGIAVPDPAPAGAAIADALIAPLTPPVLRNVSRTVP